MFYSEIGEATSGIQALFLAQGTRRTDFNATHTGSATIGLRLVVGINFFREDECANEEITSCLRNNELRVTP